MKIGSHIKKLRNARGWSQQVVANQLGMTQANYHKLESDKAHAKLATLDKIARLYNISVVDLLEYKVDKSQPSARLKTETVELLIQRLKDKEEIIKLKDDKIAQLQREIGEIKEGLTVLK